jgi:hypothetical protein
MTAENRGRADFCAWRAEFFLPGPRIEMRVRLRLFVGKIRPPDGDGGIPSSFENCIELNCEISAIEPLCLRTAPSCENL